MEKFSYEANGYNRHEVNQFVSDVITQTEGIIKRVKEQRTEIEELKKELEHYKNLEETLKMSIIRADKQAEEIKRMARSEGEEIINDAKTNASIIVNDALLRSERIENNADILEKNIVIFKQKLRAIVEQQLEIVDEIEVLELDTK